MANYSGVKLNKEREITAETMQCYDGLSITGQTH